MRRRPDEDEQEQQQRHEVETTRRGRVADQRRHRAGGSPDHDVVTRRALQPARVDEHVEQVAGECEAGGQKVDSPGQEGKRRRGEGEPELERLGRRDAAGGDRPRARATPHQPIDVAVDDVVQRARAAAGQAESDECLRGTCQRRQAGGTHDHRRASGEQQQAHDARLRQRDVVAPASRGQVMRAHAREGCPERGARGERADHEVQRRDPRGACAHRGAEHGAGEREARARHRRRAAGCDGRRPRRWRRRRAPAARPLRRGDAGSRAAARRWPRRASSRARRRLRSHAARRPARSRRAARRARPSSRGPLCGEHAQVV